MENLAPFYDTFYVAIKNCWPMMILFVMIICSIRITKIVAAKEHFIFYKEFYALLAIVYFLLLYYLLLSTEGASSGFNIIPFTEMTRYKIGSKSFYYNVIGNIVLFAPLGYIVSNYLNAKKISHILLISTLISLTAELIQFKIGRAFDIDDILLNVVGAICGFLIYVSLQAIKVHLPKFLQTNWFYNFLAVIVLLLVLCLFGSIWGLKLW